MGQWTIQIKQNAAGVWGYVFISANGRCMGHHYDYKSKRNAKRAVASIQKNAPGAEVVYP